MYMPVQSTIQWEIGVAVVEIEFATGGHSEHTERHHVVLYLTLYASIVAQCTTQLALFIHVKVTISHKTFFLILLWSVNLEQTECSLRLATLMHWIQLV